MRVLHLITDRPRPSDMLLAWACDSAGAAEGPRVWTLGGAGLPGRVAALQRGDVGGEVEIEHIAAGGGIGRRFAAMLRLRRKLRRDRPDVIHAWSVDAAAVAAWACPGLPIVLTTDVPMAGKLAAWQRAALRGGRWLTWLSPHPPTAERLKELRLGEARALRVDPPVNLERLADREGRVRRRLGWGVNEERTRIVMLVSDRPEAIEAMSAVLGVGLAWETGRDLRLVISPRASQLERALRVLRDVEQEDRVIVDAAADRPWEVAHAVDAALVPGDGLSLAWATTSGLPTVAPVEQAGFEVLGEAREHELFEAIFARPESSRPGRIAPHICRLYNQIADARRAAAPLSDDARGIYDMLTHNTRLAAVYHALLNDQTVDWPPQPTARSAAG